MKKTSSVSDSFRHRSATFYLWLCLGVLLVTGLSVIAFERHVASKGSAKTDGESLIVRRITEDDHILGAVSAPVQVVVYADLSCPYCKSLFQSTLPKLQEKYGDSIVVAFRHLPPPAHPSSRLEAHAAECVGQFGGSDSFWLFLRAVYAHPGYEEGLNVPALALIVDEIGVSGTDVLACVRSGAHDTRINADALEASIAGISQTPSIVLKSATRALIVHGNHYGQLDSGIDYLLQATF